MGYFNGLTNAWFKKTADGKAIFYPRGKFGSGYILSEEAELKIKTFLKRYYMISLPIIILSVILFGIYAFALLLFVIPFYEIKIRRLLSNAEKTQEKMTFSEVTKNMAVSMGIPTSILMLTASLLITATSVFCIFLPKGRLIGILGTLFFGLSLIISIYLLKYSIKFKKSK